MEKIDDIMKDWISDLSVDLNKVPEKLAHFSSYDSIYNILKGKSFHSSSVMFMNDPIDSRYFFDEFMLVLRKFIAENGLNSKNYIDHNADYIGSAEEFPELSEFILINLYLNLKISRQIMEYKNLDFSGVFVLSFVVDQDFDNLAYWRSYGDNGRGAAIILDGPSFIHSIASLPENKLKFGVGDFFGEGTKSSNMLHFECLYLQREKIIEMSEAIIKSISMINLKSSDLGDAHLLEIISRISGYIYAVSSFVKNNHFYSEKEFRIIFDDRGLDVPVNLDFKRSASIIMPYKDIKWDVMSTLSVLAGPKVINRSFDSLGVFCENIKKIHYPSISNINNEFVSNKIVLEKSQVPYVDNY